jgi:hypothetical protein
MSITTWTRLEPDIQTNQPALDLDQGAAARLADPLWVLGRQWRGRRLPGFRAHQCRQLPDRQPADRFAPCVVFR